MASSSHRLDDGYPSQISFINLPNVKIYEKELTPPSVSSGGAIDTTTMKNREWRTSSPKALKSLSPIKVTVAYATEALAEIKAQVGVQQRVSLNFPDATTISFVGWIDDFVPGALAEGAQPTATMSIIPSLVDESGNEEAPAYESV